MTEWSRPQTVARVPRLSLPSSLCIPLERMTVRSVSRFPSAATIGQVRENSHGFEVARLSVFDNLPNTLVEFLRTWE